MEDYHFTRDEFETITSELRVNDRFSPDVYAQVRISLKTFVHPNPSSRHQFSIDSLGVQIFVVSSIMRMRRAGSALRKVVCG